MVLILVGKFVFGISFRPDHQSVVNVLMTRPVMGWDHHRTLTLIRARRELMSCDCIMFNYTAH
jgi:hypothetical protein